MINILSFAVAIITLLFGVWALVQPEKYAKLLFLKPHKAAGITEIRSNLGGLIIGLSGFVLYNQSDLAFQMLGFAYLGIGVTRAISVFVLDKSFSQQNLYVLLFEIGASIILLV